MTDRNLEDFCAGQIFLSPHLLVGAEITAFAAEFGPQPFHLDEDAARDTIFGRSRGRRPLAYQQVFMRGGGNIELTTLPISLNQ